MAMRLNTMTAMYGVLKRLWMRLRNEGTSPCVPCENASREMPMSPALVDDFGLIHEP